jgi:hypothetical protein
VSLWVYARDIVQAGVLGYGGSGDWTSGFRRFNSQNNASFEMQGHNTVNRWIHWAVTTDAGGTKIYIDGKLVANTITGGKIFCLSGIVCPDGLSAYADPNVAFLNGVLDDARIYNRALSGEELSGLFFEGGWPIGILFNDAYSFSGPYSQPIPRGSYTASQLGSYGLDPSVISSCRVNGYMITIYNADGLLGDSLLVTTDNAGFDNNFNDRVYSAIVRYFWE